MKPRKSDLADRVAVSRHTIARLESGDHHVSIAVLTATAWGMGLEASLGQAFAPEKDPEVTRSGRLAVSQRVRKSAPSRLGDLDF